MVKANKSAKKRQFEAEKLKKNAISLKESFVEEENDDIEMSQGEEDQVPTDSENDSDPKNSSEELDDGEAVGDSEEEDADSGGEDENSEDEDEEDVEEDEEIGSLEYEESDEDDAPVLDKSVYEDSDDEDEEPKDKIVKSEKSNRRGAKRMKLEKTENKESDEDDNDENDDDDEIREEPIKREPDVKENPLKRKNASITKKKSKEQKEETPIISVEEIPMTYFVRGLPATLDKNQVIEFLEQHIKFKRVFSQKVKRRPQQSTPNLYVVFENEKQIEKVKQTKIVYKDPLNPKLPEKQITFVESRWTSFSSLNDHCVCVKNLEPTITKEQLEKSFKTFGNILNIDIIKQIKGEAIRSPIAYIFFEKVSSAELALQISSVKFGKTDAKVESMRIKETHLEKYIKIGVQGAPLQVKDCSKTLFVGNASIHTTNKDVESFLSKFGKINRVRGFDVETLKHQKFRKFHVVFDDSKGYANALKTGNLVLAKQNLHVTPLKWETVPEFCDFIVKVTGISLTVEKEQLKEKFEKFGPIECIELKALKGKSHAYALIFYKKKEAAQKALSFDGSIFEGNSLSVSKHKCFEDLNTIYVEKPRNGKVTGEDVKAALKVFGKIKVVKVLLNCFSVTFFDKVHSFKALKNKTVEIAGISLRLYKNEMKKETKGHKSSFGVLVTGFPKTTTIQVVRDHFKDCGEIKKSYICNSSNKNGVAFIEFTNAAEKAKAFKFNKTLLNGKSIFVKNALTRN